MTGRSAPRLRNRISNFFYPPPVRRRVIPQPLIPNPFVPPTIIDVAPPVPIDYEKLASMLMERMRDDPNFIISGQLRDYINQKLLEISKQQGPKGDKGDQGIKGQVDIIIQQKDPTTGEIKELYRLENVQAGSKIEVPVETYPKPKVGKSNE